MRVIIRRVNVTEIEVLDNAAFKQLCKDFLCGNKDVTEYCAEFGLSGESTYTVKVKEF